MPDYSPEMKAQIAAMLAAKARERKSVDDPVTRYVLNMQGGERLNNAQDVAQQQAAAQAAARRRRENETWDRVDKALVYSPSPAIDASSNPSFIPAQKLGMAADNDPSRGYLHGMDASQLKPQDIEFLRRWEQRRQKKGATK